MDNENINDNRSSLAIIMSTKNGGKYINDQLESIKSQKFKSLDLYISDNSSQDDTVEKIKQFKRKNPNLNIFLSKGDDDTFAKNFLKLLCSIKLKYKFYAFCDQDDIWLDFHLKRSVEEIISIREDIPYLCCSRTYLVNKKGVLIGRSKLFKRPPSFKNALVQSIAGGNTMIFNRRAYDLVLNANIQELPIPSHDWFLYLLVTAYNGKVSYCQKPSVKYRQHDSNLVGSNRGLLSFFRRFYIALNGQWKLWIDCNLELLKSSRNLPKESINIINKFKLMLSTNKTYDKLKIFRELKIYRQTFYGNINLLIALLINRL
tara:strand:+ start:525 stop:1475 length:951 start_codon:yes stop_codon:yes gene_type:complete